MSEEEGIYGKYKLSKTDGSEVDPDACYFVLRLDTDKHARKAAKAYAKSCKGELGEDILACLDGLERKPCGCRGLADCNHFGFGSSVWRHGGNSKRKTTP